MISWTLFVVSLNSLGQLPAVVLITGECDVKEVVALVDAAPRPCADNRQ